VEFFLNPSVLVILWANHKINTVTEAIGLRGSGCWAKGVRRWPSLGLADSSAPSRVQCIPVPVPRREHLQDCTRVLVQ